MERSIVEFAFRAALIAAAAAVILRVLRIQAAAAQHAIWTSVLVVMLALPVWIFWGPRAALPVLPARGGSALLAAPVNTGDPTPAVPLRLEASQPAPTPAWNSEEVRSWSVVWIGAYLLGAGALLLRLVIGTIRANRLNSASCSAPVTVGLLRPRVILPERWREWPQAQLDAVLIHERAHARRRDPLVQWMALLNRALFWFHPLAWWLERRLSALAEEACDAAVIEQGHDPRDYSGYLLDLARAVQRAGVRVNVTGMAMPGSYLTQRIRKIMAGVTVSRVPRARMAGAAVACAICSATFAAATLEHVRKPAPVLLAQAKPGSSTQTRGPAEQFEVASVKPSDPVPPRGGVYFGPARGGPGTSDPELIRWSYARLKDLLLTAYDVKAYQVSGPVWLDTERYDIVAKVPPGATKEQVRVMWQSLLAERFGLKLHHESKEFKVEDLVVATGGHKLKESVVDDPDAEGPPKMDKNGDLTGPGLVWIIKPGPNGQTVHGVARAQPLSKLTVTIGGQIHRPVLDKTGLTGKYDFTLDFTPDLPPSGPGQPGP
jgi:uncharacterized protein (TIGR03435 family)